MSRKPGWLTTNQKIARALGPVDRRQASRLRGGRRGGIVRRFTTHTQKEGS